MCTVLAYFGTDLSRESFESYLNRTTERGPDDAKIVPLPCGGFFGFQRLAIMGLTRRACSPSRFGKSGHLQRRAVWLPQDEA